MLLVLALISTVITSVIGQIIMPYGYDDSILYTNLGLYYCIFGILGTIIASFAINIIPLSLNKMTLLIGAGSLATFFYFIICTTLSLSEA